MLGVRGVVMRMSKDDKVVKSRDFEHANEIEYS